MYKVLSGNHLLVIKDHKFTNLRSYRWLKKIQKCYPLKSEKYSNEWTTN